MSRLDMAIRAVSAIGILLLGLAGWLLQMRTEEARKEREDKDRASRRYLPLLRSLTELEFVAYEGANIVSIGRVDPRKRAEFVRKIDMAAQGIVLGGQDLPVEIGLPDVANESNAINAHRLGVRATAVMIADLLMALDYAQKLSSDRKGALTLADTISVDYDQRNPIILVKMSFANDVPIPLLAHDESIGVWQEWIGKRPAPLLYCDASVGVILRALHRQAKRATDEILSLYPELGEAYSTIRREVVADYLRPGIH